MFDKFQELTKSLNNNMGQELGAMEREKDLSDKLILAVRDRKLFKERVQENYDKLLAMQERVRALEVVIAAKDVSVVVMFRQVPSDLTCVAGSHSGTGGLARPVVCQHVV